LTHRRSSPLEGVDPDDEDHSCFRRRPVSHGSRRCFPRFSQSNFSLYIGTPWLSTYSYNYLPHCYYEPRLVTIKVSNGYGGVYFKKIWKDVRVCY
jgi:hypothetical protein